MYVGLLDAMPQLNLKKIHLNWAYDWCKVIATVKQEKMVTKEMTGLFMSSILLISDQIIWMNIIYVKHTHTVLWFHIIFMEF